VRRFSGDLLEERAAELQIADLAGALEHALAGGPDRLAAA
jgi:hypothetical protein